MNIAFNSLGAGGILALSAGLILVVFIGLLGGMILLKIYKDEIDLSKLISETNGDASMSRLQLLVFTFVIAMSLFIVVAGNSKFAFPDDIPSGVLTLLGISGSSYLVSKAIQGSDVKATLSISGPPVTPVAPGAQVVLTVSLLNAPSGAALPPLTWSLDAPAHGNIIAGAAGLATYTAPTPSPAAGTKVTVRAHADGFDDGTAVITLQGSGPKAGLTISAPPATPVAPGAPVVLTVSLLNAPTGTAVPPLTWSLAAPAHGNIVPGAAGTATYTAPTPSPAAGTKVTVHAQADGFDDGTAVITLA